MRKEFKECKVEGCSKKTKAFGYCNTHYSRFKLYGESLQMKPENKKPKKDMLTVKDMTGQVFGNLTVIGRTGSKVGANGAKYATWLCQCACGNQKEIIGVSLRDGNTTSCGCLKGYKKHGMANERIYHIHAGIKQRCNNSKDTAHENYYDKGIKVCEEWSDKENGFTNFYEWSLKNGYAESLTIDRIDYKGNYSPENCRWVDMVVQANNRENNHTVTINGETKTVMEWANIIGITSPAFTCRLEYNWNDNEILQPKGFKRTSKKITKKD